MSALPFVLSANSDEPSEIQTICARVAARGADRRGYELDCYSLEEAVQEMVVWLIDHDAYDSDAPRKSAGRAWSAIWRRILPVDARHGGSELDEEIAQQQEDSLTSIALWQAMQRMSPEDRAAAVDIIEGNVSLSGKSGAYKRRVNRVKAALAAAIA